MGVKGLRTAQKPSSGEMKRLHVPLQLKTLNNHKIHLCNADIYIPPRLRFSIRFPSLLAETSTADFVEMTFGAVLNCGALLQPSPSF